MEKDLKILVGSGEVRTTNPEKMSAEDVLAYVGFQRKKGLKETAISHNVTVLKSLLSLVGNPAVDQCKARNPTAMPKKRKARMPSMKVEDFHRVLAEARAVADSDWIRMKAYTIVVLAICTGLRLKEIRMSRVSDVDLDDGIMHAEHVKGEGTYGEPRPTVIMLEGLDVVARYLRVRNELVSKKCPSNLALFPAMRDEVDGYYSTNGIERLKRLVESETGIKFDLRMCRRTFGQMLIDRGLNLDSVSVMMGHANTKTTETFYCRKRPEVAIREAQALCKGEMSHPDAKNLKIESGEWTIGYA
ncbi:MAG: site-specific integrase [Methanomassiliicoccales archaeon]